ncbi:class I SAM-dependent methyltransferase [Streptomyces sp. W16]|uniref:class I SAM-dependent methyltransferase n=1 Tax=Streptomyces sp. W16 TaxID=3076631 RepID=UPI00295AA1FB|nr:class I SAM-dependent methyltransferase [Streptomyces sp. W16]MDV9177161.1 class I SAM-dependent methyltransferase [Streptomyces sp. W16]
MELWAVLPPGDIPAIIEPALPPNARILDLGAGAGRLTHPLAAAGHHVTAVDESAEMLSHIHQAETICSTIESLRLDRQFDVVLLASHLVNVPDTAKRNGILATCRHHVAEDGVVLIQRFTHRWAQEAGGPGHLGAGIETETTVEPNSAGRDLVSVVARYSIGDQHWEQEYVTCLLDDSALSTDLNRARLQLDRWLSEDGRWVVAKPEH